MTCEVCGRVGSRGFDVFIRLHPQPNRIVCANWKACNARAKRGKK